MEFHPDGNLTPGAAASMVAINEAYAVLGEPTRRRPYDQERKRVLQAFAGACSPRSV